MNSSAASWLRPSSARRGCRALASGLKRAVSTPYGTTSIRSSTAPSASARRARSPLQAVDETCTPETARAATRAGLTRSATNTSDPCRLTTSGRRARRRLPHATGTTQCACMIVARRFCATRIALNQPAVIARGAAIHAVLRSRTSACMPAAYPNTFNAGTGA